MSTCSGMKEQLNLTGQLKESKELSAKGLLKLADNGELLDFQLKYCLI